jgi:hypothetical protein
MADEEKGKFSGLFGSLKKMVFTDDYLESKEPEMSAPTPKPVVPNFNTTFNPAPIAVPNSNTAGVVTTNMASNEMIAKIYDLFESINKPGVDFFELWNAAEAMGGPTAVNLQNAFTSFKILGLDKPAVISSGENYVAELQNKLGADIQRKTTDKNDLIAKLQNEKNTLQNDKQNLEAQVQALNTQLADTNNKLNQIDASYQTELQIIDKKIVMGKNALNTVVNQINNVIQIIKTSVN